MRYYSSVILAGLIAWAPAGQVGHVAPEAASLAPEAAPVAPEAAPVETRAGAQESPKAVLVTGASSGIGRKITEHLAASGYFVYAGARSEGDLRELNAMENVQSIRPANGLAPKHLGAVLGRCARRDIRRGEPMSWNLLA